MTNQGSNDQPGGSGPSSPPEERRQSPRSNVAVPLMCRYDSVLDFVETQSMNISETGMFIATETPAAVGARIDFSFILADGFTLLHGTAQVVRSVTAGPINGMGVRFLELDEQNRLLIRRIVDVNSREGRNATTNFDFSRPAAVTAPVASPADRPSSVPSPVAVARAPAVAVSPIRFEGRTVQVVLGSQTVAHFTQNPLLNVRSGGFFIPAEEDVPLGTVFQVEILDGAGAVVVAGKGKVVAKQDLRIGVRLADVDKEALARLRAEVEKLGVTK